MNDLTKKILKVFHSDERGFTLVEIMIAGAMLSFVALGTVSVVQLGLLGERSLTVQDDTRTITAQMASLLTNSTACANTFASQVSTPANNAPVGASFTVPAIKDAAGNNVFAVGTTYGNRSITLKSITVGGSTTVADARTGSLPFTVTDTTHGRALVKIVWTVQGTNVGTKKYTASGAYELSRFFYLTVTHNPAAGSPPYKIVDCQSNGVAVAVIARTCSPGSQTFSSPGSSDTFTIPTYEVNLIAKVWGGGGGGGGDGPTAPVAGSTGSASSFNGLVANGGTGGAVGTTAVAHAGGGGGTASGGSTNTTGATGGTSIVTNGAAGGAAPGSGGSGGAAQTVAGTAGNSGNAPGGGGGGSLAAMPTANWGGGGGGSGGYSTKTYLPGDLVLGAELPVTIGAGGAGGAGGANGFAGGAGASGRVEITWTCESGEGDNLGDHTLIQNLNTNGYYISGDGIGNKGLFVDSAGNVGIFYLNASSTTPSTFPTLPTKLFVTGAVKIGNDAGTCNAAKAGTTRWNGSKIQICDGTTDWADIAPAASAGKYFNYQSFTANGTWSKPGGVSDTNAIVFVQAWGGGGGGSSGATGGGGGGGAYSEARFRLSDLGATAAVVVGAGGTVAAQATAGGNTSFNGVTLAYGGAGGNASLGGGGGGTVGAPNATNGTGGAPKPGSVASPGGDSSYGGAGGGLTGGLGGNSYFGGGGGGGNTRAGGISVYGGGGGAGAGGTLGDSKFGGDGGASGVAGTAPGGGGGRNANGAAGEVRAWVIVGAEGLGLEGDNLGDHVLDMNLRTNNFFISSDGDSEGIAVSSSGNVGIGTSTPRAKLDVSGGAMVNAIISNASRTIDFSTGNVQKTTSSCGAFTLQNLKDGGSYSLAITGSSTNTCSFTAAGFTVHLPPNHTSSYTQSDTIYNFQVFNTDVYVSWVTGYDNGVADCGGTQVGGYCWYVGAEGASCTTTCASHGAYDAATRTYAGDSGTLAQCDAVLEALSGSTQSTADVGSCASGRGCKFEDGASMSQGERCTGIATDAASSGSGESRACACTN